ncbi:centrosome-associated protein CEP250-like [Oncorhynchus masou masou]|uniref:centrosome-associated protein CEP250-like n=1 Tax=Oncorhynchus masou masou TaxID=90313 RepID=UPI003183E9DF
MIGYRDRAHQQEQSRGAGSERAVAQIEMDPVVQERLSVLQRAVAQIEMDPVVQDQRRGPDRDGPLVQERLSVLQSAVAQIEMDPLVQERLSVLQSAVAQLEMDPGVKDCLSVLQRAVAQIEMDPLVQERLSVLQRAVAQLEIDHRRLQRRNTLLEQRTDRLKTERKHLREMLTQTERGSSRDGLSSSSLRDRAQESRGLVGLETEELGVLRTKVKELENQVHYLQLTLVLDHRERLEFIQHSSRNNQWLVSLRQDLTDSLVLVSQQPIPSVLESETHRLDRSVREEEMRLSLSQS